MKKISIYFLKEFLLTTLITFSIFVFQIITKFLVSFANSFNDPTFQNILIFSLIAFLASAIQIIVTLFHHKRNDELDYLTFEMKNKNKKILLTKLLFLFLICPLSFLIGVGVGEEGFNVMIGAILAVLISKIFNHDLLENRLIRYGEVLGYTLTYTNPLAGFFKFYQGKKYNKKLFFDYVLTMINLFYAYLLISLLKGNFYFNNYFDLLNSIKGVDSLILLILPIFVLPFATLFKYLIKFLKIIFNKNKIIKYIIIPLIVFISAIVLRYLNPILVGSGAEIFSKPFLKISILTLFLFIIIRLFFVASTYASIFAGGIGICVLALGFLIGNFVVVILSSSNFYLNESTSLIIMIVSSLIFYEFVFNNILVSSSLLFSFGNPLFLLPPVIISFSIIYLIEKIIPLHSINQILNDKTNKFSL